MGYQRRRENHFRWIKQQIDAGVFGKLVNAEANISRDRLGKIDLSSWRYQASGMPGGVMLQIGIHYTDVLTYLMGPVKAVRGQFAQLVLPGDNPDVASLLLEHDSGALSTLNASYASASEYYLMNIYGKDATAYYDMHGGLRLLKRGEDKPAPVATAKNDTFVEELEEFAAAAPKLHVINALSDSEHPCQALSDFLTLREHWGTLRGRTVAYVGELEPEATRFSHPILEAAGIGQLPVSEAAMGKVIAAIREAGGDSGSRPDEPTTRTHRTGNRR